MARKSCLLAVLTLLGGLSFALRGHAQAPANPATGTATTEAESDVLPGLPHPPDTPQSLLLQPAAAAPFSCAPLPGRYFERDPLLDPPETGLPGWVVGVDLAIVGPHVKNRLTDTVQVAGRPPDTLHLPSADLDWTVSPRVELGYRLPSGFGEFAMSYREMASDGTASVAGPDGAADLKSRLDVNIGDLDYISREWSLWPDWGMKWWFGLRLANIYFDSHETEPFTVADAAVAGSGVFDRQTSNHYLGGGPHYGLELTRQWKETGLSFVARLDGAALLGRVTQNFSEVSTTAGPGGELLAGVTHESNPQAVPMLNAFLGVNWNPPGIPKLLFSAGYEYEYWWEVGRLGTTLSRGEFSDQGVMLRASFNF